MTRGQRNNNPLNIRLGSTRWFGQLDPALAAVSHKEKSFCVFVEVRYGFRAAFILLRTYRRRYGRSTIRGIVSRWAPPTENATTRYMEQVAAWTGFGLDQALTDDMLPALVKAMARVETSHIFDDADIMAGFEMYKSYCITH